MTKFNEKTSFLGHTKIVKTLVQKNANVNNENGSKSTALMQAAALGHTEIVRFLLQNGANVNAVDYHNYSCNCLKPGDLSKSLKIEKKNLYLNQFS